MPDAAPVMSATLPSSAATTAGYAAIWEDALIAGRDGIGIAGATAVVLAIVLGGSALAGAAPAARTEPCPGGTTRARGGGDVCVDRTDRRSAGIAEAVHEVQAQNPLHAIVFGVWIDGRPLVTGALGEALPGAPATTADHFRIGNVYEAMTSTMLLQFVEQGRLSLDDPVSKWFPSIPNADQVTLGMLARSTSGYVDYVTSDAFVQAFNADPFRKWRPQELIDIGTSQPLLFAPGTNWSFSDTNFMILGQILERVGGRPLGETTSAMVLRKLDLRNTVYTPTASITPPVLHGYDTGRGVYEDCTFWDPSWATGNGSMTSNLGDMGRWASALGTGELLSPKSHQLQVGNVNVGLGPNTPEHHYGLGALVVNGWILSNPQLVGYAGVAGYLPSKKITVVAFATVDSDAPVGLHGGALAFNRIAELLAPDAAPNLTTNPRGAAA
jgi:D-alanyl-D-alanine carboxypeptidase